MADDLAAETFIRAFERRSAYEPTAERALPWLLGIALNLLAHHRRSEARQFRALAAAGGLESGARAEVGESRGERPRATSCPGSRMSIPMLQTKKRRSAVVVEEADRVARRRGAGIASEIASQSGCIRVALQDLTLFQTCQ